MSDHRNFHVITGGPGAGKTTLIAALASRGVAGFPEAGRSIIQAQRTIGRPVGHDGDRALYAELMLSWDIRSHAEACGLAGPVVFDRGIPDLIGYLQLCGLVVPAHFIAAARRFRYARTVFVAPGWEAIYANDAERRQDFSEARETEAAIRAAYAGLGYDCIDLPHVPVGARAEFVLKHCLTNA